MLRVPAAESACGQGRLSVAESACGVYAVSASESACGQGLRTGAHLRCFPSHRCAVGPSPFTKPRAATPSEVPAHPEFLEHGIILSLWFPGDASILDFMGQTWESLQGLPGNDLVAAVILDFRG